jgi:predicted transcriptional regulator
LRKASLGEQELELLRYVTEYAPVTVSEVVEGYGEQTRLSRSTIKTMMERLHKKGFLARELEDGSFHYVSAMPKSDLLQSLVSNFVEKTLAGSLSPFIAYLAKGKEVSDQEFAELEELVAKLGSKRKEPGV